MAKILIAEGKLNSGQYAYAGKEKMIQWLGNELATLGHDVTFCTTYDSKKSPKMSDNVLCIPLNMRYHSSFLARNFNFFLRYPLKLYRVLMHKKYEYVLSFGDTSYFILVLFKHIFNYKLVVSERGDPSYNITILDKLRRKMYSMADTIVFQTSGAQAFFNKKVIDKSVIICNAVSIPEQAWTLNNNCKDIANVGRIDFRQKRQDLLCYSFANVLKKHPFWRLNFYGSGEDMPKLVELVKSLGIENNVIIHGAVSNINNILISNRIFVLTSDFEGIPNALLEAMALGMPVISTDCSPGGASMLINNYNNGILVERDNIHDISDAICKLIENPQISEKLGQMARKSMLQYTSDKIIHKWNNLFFKADSH